MAPIRTYTNWNSRYSEETEQIEPYRKYFFICEGANTETWYFKELINLRKVLGIHPLIDIILLEKTDEDRTLSYPHHLIEFADKQKQNPDIAFDRQRDKMIVVFDADIFENRVANYDEIVALGEQKNILAITNPSFELFLLLHFEDSYDTIIMPHADEIIKNRKDGNQTFICQLLCAQTQINSKKNPAIGKLAANIEIAILQEEKINQDIYNCKGKITSNIGKIIRDIKKDSAETGLQSL